MRGDEISYISTYSGGKFWPLDPHPDDLKIEDIAHALSNLCRWTGHSKKFYSVAQHCILVSENLPPLLQLEGLLHDASEAYLSDLSRPVKYAPGLGEVYRRAERKIEIAIAKKFGLPEDFSPMVKVVDDRLLRTEKRDLVAGEKWNELSPNGKMPFDFTIDPWPPERAEQEFLQRFHLLTSPNTFTTGEYGKMIGLSRHAALVRLQKLEERGIVERTLVFQNQGGVVRKNVVGWRFLQSGNLVTGNNISDRRSGVDAEVESPVVARNTSGKGDGERGKVAGGEFGAGGGGGSAVSSEEMAEYVQSGLTAGL